MRAAEFLIERATSVLFHYTSTGAALKILKNGQNEPVDESYQPPELSTGDTVLMGKFKNRKAEIKSFTKDKHNQPVLKTNKGEVQLFKPRIVKLMSKDVVEAEASTKNSNEIWRQLRAAGYQSVGSGADSTVWAKDDNYIIKILMPEDLGNKAEQVFRKFYEFSIEHQDLTCLPRFNQVNIIDINGKDYTQIEMERLKPIEKGTFMEGVVWFFSDFCQTQTPWDKVSQAMRLSDTWEWYPYTKNSKSIANVYIKQWQDVMYNKKSYAMYRQLYNVMQLLYNAGTINKFGWDLHTANVMQRQNGQPVIIDPWFSEGTS